MIRLTGWKASVIGAGCLVALLSPVAVSANLPESCENGAQWPPHKVSKIVDGDTLKLVDGRSIRVLGLNSPELYVNDTGPEPLSDEARRALAGFIGQDVRLRLGEVRLDKHRRWLAHIYDNKGDNIAAKLLQLGLGFQVVQAPEVYGADCYRDAESVAKKQKRGVWGEPSFAPSEASQQKSLNPGFARVLGQVENITFNRESVWIDLQGDVTLYIPSEAKPYFHSVLSSSLMGDRVAVQGWVVDRERDKYKKKHIRKRWMLILTHPNMVEFSKKVRDQS